MKRQDGQVLSRKFLNGSSGSQENKKMFMELAAKHSITLPGGTSPLMCSPEV